jgi:phospholipase/carboxylesterase
MISRFSFRDRPGLAEGGPTLVLLHGIGSNESDLFVLAPLLDPKIRVVTLRAPNAYRGGGYAWFDIQWLPEGRVIDVEGALASRDLLVEELAHIGASRLLLGGFSQGAMMTLGVAMARPDLLAGCLMMSGRNLSQFEPASDALLPPFFVQHGLHDEILSVAEGREVRDRLAELGVPVEYREYPMGHQVSTESVQDAIEWVHERLLGG